MIWSSLFVLATAGLLYFLALDVNLFQEKGSLVVFTLSHLNTHINIRAIHQNHISFGFHFLIVSLIMFTKVFLLKILFFDQYIWEDKKYIFYIQLLILQSLVFGHYALTRRIQALASRVPLISYFLSVGDRLSQTGTMILVFEQVQIKGYFSLVAFLAYLVPTITILTLRDQNYTFIQTLKKTGPYFVKNGIVYFITAFLAITWNQRRQEKDTLLAAMNDYHPVLHDDFAKTIFMGMFLLMESFYNLNFILNFLIAFISIKAIPKSAPKAAQSKQAKGKAQANKAKQE